MAMICTQCNTSHDQRLQCPSCGCRLIYRARSFERVAQSRARGLWLHSFVGRIIIGLLLAQGLYFGLRHFVTGFVLAIQGEEALHDLLLSWGGRVLLESLQLAPLLLAGLLAGAGQRQVLLMGCSIGLCNSALSMLMGALLTHQASSLSWYGQPLLQGIFGALGAWVGATIWKPLIIASRPVELNSAPRKEPPRWTRSLLGGPIAWFRVSLGVLLAVAGSLWAEFLFQSFIRASAGQLETASYQQDAIFTWEVKALALLFGGALAGATKTNGVKQGICVGFATSFVLLITPSGHGGILVALLGMVAAFLLSVAGGWFGSQLLPPVMPRSNGRHGTTAAY